MTGTMVHSMLRAKEEQFWKGDAQFYERNLADDALMVFAHPTKVLTRDRIVDSITTSRRWTTVKLEDVRFLRLNETAIILTYAVSAQRAGTADIYSALASSVYALGDRGWVLAFHQQTPATDVARDQ